MRTTLELDDDLVAAAKELGRKQGVTLGAVITDLARKSLHATAPMAVRNGVRLFVPKAGAGKSNLRTVNALRDDA